MQRFHQRTHFSDRRALEVGWNDVNVPLIFQNIGCLIRGGAGRPKKLQHGETWQLPFHPRASDVQRLFSIFAMPTAYNRKQWRGTERLFMFTIHQVVCSFSMGVVQNDKPQKNGNQHMIHHICDGQEMVYGSHDFGPSLSLTYPGACMEGQSVCTYSQNGFICVCVELCCKVTPFDANRSYDGSRCNCRFGKEWVGLNVGIMGILTMGIPVKMNPIQLAWPWMTMTYNM